MALALVLGALPARAACTGTDLIAALPAETRARLQARADAVPFATGNFWQASRGDERITLIGTYHLDDPRHEATMAWLDPLIAGAGTVLVEAGAEEEAKLKAQLSKDPGLLLDLDGPTLPERLAPQDWEALSKALSARGVPPFMAARMKPWYLTTLLAVPPCMMPADGLNGLDARVIAAAGRHGVKVQALEAFDTVLGLFDGFSPQEEQALLVAALANGDRPEDDSITTAEAYFRGENQLLWEYSVEVATTAPGAGPEVAEAMAETQETLISARNRAWIPVIEAAAAGGPVLAAFGALHLPGDQGVLALLQARGWTIAPLSP